MPVPGLLEALNHARALLLAERGTHGHWEGALSSSALSTATAVFALSQVLEGQGNSVDPAFATRAGKLIRQGLGWLALHQNTDGGWGDTTASFSNVSTTCLCWSAFVADENWAAGAYDATLSAVDQWLIKNVGTLAPEKIAQKVTERYGEDHTFSVPILTMCALAGRLGQGLAAWDLVPALPFELAAFPQRWFKWLKLPVVSYALPALIAIGQVRHALRPSLSPVSRFLRNLTRGRTLKLLTRIQPGSGGFLEATPLTSFVVMSLAASGNAKHPVVQRGVQFLIDSVRPDGSWPIDTNLATWVTTLAVNALANSPNFDAVLPEGERQPIGDWLLGQQYRTEHPYTLANPGGWSWTDLPGGVPDADDTPGALLALHHLAGRAALAGAGTARPAKGEAEMERASEDGLRWLCSVQNSDGGIPTFCKGWGKLPFDRSSCDLTAHFLRAASAWKGKARGRFSVRLAKSVKRADLFLDRSQHADGSWAPLWFGNQHADTETNRIYGTSRVLLARPKCVRGLTWLLRAQQADGGWGGGANGPASIEETALAIEAIATHLLRAKAPVGAGHDAVDRGVQWLIEATTGGTHFPPTPIGFYFAKLWYWEKLYPLIWTVSALGLADALEKSEIAN